MNPLEAVLSGSYAAGWAAVRTMPEGMARRLFRAGADAALLKGGFEQLTANLARVAPGQDLRRAAVRSYARYWCEVFRLPAMSRDRIVSGTTTTDEQLLRDSVASDRGTILVLPHTGNWDAAGAWCGLTGVPFTTVAERLKPESLFEQFLAFRQSLGMEVLPLTGGPGPFDTLRKRLEAGGTICLLADRDLTPRGVDVQFFGSTARMPAGPAKLALETGANLMPTTLSFTDDGWHIAFQPCIAHSDLTTMTQEVADAFARGIARHPADWHMLQRLWLEDLPDDDPRKQPQ
ncbi:MAG: phosphatidylinositol mannoside acyltransferase [Mycobacteriales bacterium]